MSATNFVGNGWGLFNLNPANLMSGGTAPINITGSAATAGFATSSGNAGTAGSAANLGGVAAGNYARRDTENSFAGNQIIGGIPGITENLNVGWASTLRGPTTLGSGGTPILKHLSATTPLTSFAALNPATCGSITLNISEAADGDTVAIGVPNSLMTAGTSGGAVLDFFAWVSGAGQITIRECNIGSAKQKSTASGTIRVDVWKH